MRITMGEDERSGCEWLHGLCHVHALESVRLHGGFFIVVTDNDGAGPDDVLHVLSAHGSPSGTVIRDAAGEADIGDVFGYVDELFPGRFGDVFETGEAGIGRLISEGRLAEVTPGARDAASSLTSVTSVPGSVMEQDGPCP